MNKKILLILFGLYSMYPLLIIAQEIDDSCRCKAVSHSFFSIRPVYQINSPEYLVHNHNGYKERIDGCGGSFQAILLGGKSTHDDAIARFFTPFCRTILNVNEAQLAGTDILASHLNIYTLNGTFASTVEFKPHHSYIGAGFNYQQVFYERCNGHNFWFTVSGPVVQVRNRIELIETITDDGGGPIASPALSTPTGGCPENCPNPCNTDCILDPAQALPPVGSVVAAFAQPGWCFGRIDDTDNSRHRKTRVGDVTVRVGYETVKCDAYYLDSYGGIIIPTGNTPKGIDVFEPIVGHNHHWGFLLGSSFGMEVWQSECSDTKILSTFDLNITTFFERNERRSFDLKYKPWSRYMQFYKNAAQAQLAAAAGGTDYGLILHTPGIDILTQDLKVKPGYYRTFNGAFILQRNCFEAEVGWNFFARQAECVKLGCDFPEGTALKSITAGAGATGTFQTINNNFGANCLASPVGSFADNIITVDDLDLESAAHPAYLTHTAYASVAYKTETCNGYPLFFGIGGSYEFPPDNVGLNRWMAWGKFGLAF